MTESLPYKRGRHVVICQQTGKAKYDDEVVRQYDGLIVARGEADPQHPQELIRMRPERPARQPLNPPAATDTFVNYSNRVLMESTSEVTLDFVLTETGGFVLLEDNTPDV